MKIEDFNELTKDGFVGYYWYSDKKKPVVNDFSNLKLSENQLPFVIEGYLYNSKTRKSISIKNYNGSYYIKKYDIEELENSKEFRIFDEISVPAINKLDNVKKLKLRKLQIKEIDSLGFFSWSDAADIFVGFEFINLKK